MLPFLHTWLSSNTQFGFPFFFFLFSFPFSFHFSFPFSFFFFFFRMIPLAVRITRLFLSHWNCPFSIAHLLYHSDLPCYFFHVLPSISISKNGDFSHFPVSLSTTPSGLNLSNQQLVGIHAKHIPFCFKANLQRKTRAII